MKNQCGFSLIEIMVAIAILALITGVVGTAVYKQYERAKIETTKIQVQQIDEAVELHKLAHRKYPSAAVGLAEVAFKGNKRIPRDPWDHDYSYAVPGEHNRDRFDVSSHGPDETHGSKDDIGNWDSDDRE